MKQFKNNLLTVKEFSQLTHTSIDTLKHYDRIGILKPAYTGENNYRYYRPEQSLLLTRIIFSVKAKAPLTEIKAIINTDNPDEAVTHYEEIYEKLELKIQELKAVQNTINNLKYYYKLYKNNPLGELFLHYFPEWFIIFSPKLKIGAEYEASESNIANGLFIKGFSNGFWPHYQLGAFITEDEIKKGAFQETSYFLKVDCPEDFPKEELQFVPGGDYLCLLTKGKGQNLPFAVTSFLEKVEQSNLHTTGHIFIMDVVNNLITSNPNNYCTLIFAKKC
jgi:DNA-binding transcriptional MerR regulator/effector-binding domain-containing protein